MKSNHKSDIKALKFLRKLVKASPIEGDKHLQEIKKLLAIARQQHLELLLSKGHLRYSVRPDLDRELVKQLLEAGKIVGVREL